MVRKAAKPVKAKKRVKRQASQTLREKSPRAATPKKSATKAGRAVSKKTVPPKRVAAKQPKPAAPKKPSLRTPQKEPRTMEELLQLTGYELRGIKRGQLTQGTITDISRKMVLVDIGGKTEGLVVDKEYEAAREFIAELSVGDTITVYVLTPENDRGQILLSLKKAATDRTWEKFQEALKTGEVITVRGLETNRGGVIVRADSLQGFVPSSQFGKLWLGKTEELIDRSFQVRVIEVDREKNRLIFSEKQVSEAEELKQRAEALKQIKAGEVYEGLVSGIMPFGVFVSVDIPINKSKKQDDTSSVIGKVEGLVHISEISWEKVDDPNQYFKIGQKVRVKVLGIEGESGKLNLSVKRLTSDPWEGIEKQYPSGSKIKGKVTRVAPFGAFVSLAPGIEGLLHISKIPAGKEPEAGQPIEVFVEQVDPEHRRMSLGMVLKEVPVGYK